MRFVDDSRERLLSARAYLDDSLGRIGLRVHKSETIYALVDLGPRASASMVRSENPSAMPQKW